MMCRVLQMFHIADIALKLLQAAQTLKMAAHMNLPMNGQPALGPRREAHQAEHALQGKAGQMQLLV